MRIDSFLKQSPVFQAGRAVRRMEAALNAVLRSESLTHVESLVLASIFLEMGSVRPSELARTFETTRGNISHTVSSLEAKRLVRRRIDPDDARGFLLELEPAGRKRAARAVGILDRMQAHFESQVGSSRLEATLRSLRAVEASCSDLPR